jgi:hypothetical protein
MVKIEPPDYYHGFPFEGIFKSKDDREYIHAAADRFDEYYDQIRAVRDKQYKYLRNYNTDKPYYLPLEYRERMNSMQELLLLEKEGKLNGNQMQWFRKSKPEEELFDTFSDPHELRNLAKEPNFEKKLIELRKECDRWIQNTNDKGFMLETDLIETFWPNKKQPKTADPMITIIDGMLHVTCETDGAGIGYKYRPSDIQPHIGWRTYTKPFKVYGNQEVELISHRIGFLPSQIKKYKNEI